MKIGVQVKLSVDSSHWNVVIPAERLFKFSVILSPQTAGVDCDTPPYTGFTRIAEDDPISDVEIQLVFLL